MSNANTARIKTIKSPNPAKRMAGKSWWLGEFWRSKSRKWALYRKPRSLWKIRLLLSKIRVVLVVIQAEAVEPLGVDRHAPRLAGLHATNCGLLLLLFWSQPDHPPQRPRRLLLTGVSANGSLSFGKSSEVIGCEIRQRQAGQAG